MVRYKNNSLYANSSLRILSKSWQHYFNAKRRFALAQAVDESGI